MGAFKDEYDATQAEIERLNAESEHIAFVATARDRHFRDNSDAAQVASLRQLGRDIGQSNLYEKRISRLLKERGY